MKSIKFSAILIMFTAILFSSCSKEAGFANLNNITGVVTLNGAPVQGAYVQLAFGATAATTDFNATTVTDKDGKYTFAGLNKGDYYLGASYTGAESIKFKSDGAVITLGKKKGDATVDLTLK